MKTLPPHPPLTIPTRADAEELPRDEDIRILCTCGHEMTAISADLNQCSGVDAMGDRNRQRIRIALYCRNCDTVRIYRGVIAQLHATDAGDTIKTHVKDYDDYMGNTPKIPCNLYNHTTQPF